MAQQKDLLSDAFIKLFVRELILNSYRHELVKQEAKQVIIEKKPQEKPRQVIMPQIKTPLLLPKKVRSVVETKAPELPPLPIKKPENIQEQKPQPKPQQTPMFTSVSDIKLKQLDLGKISLILRDPTVLSVESPGPGKNLLINKHGIVQPAPIVLGKDEINKIMDEVSVKTRIPLIPGLFKVVLNDTLIIAVVSEFVGTRFLIQKRMPFQQPTAPGIHY